MVTTTSTVVLLKTWFIFLLCVIAAAFVYLFMFCDYISCFDIPSRGFILIMADFATDVIVLGVWIAYKESSWIIAVVLMVAMYFLGSHVGIGYILIQFYKLSHEETLKDPLYFVLARRLKNNRPRDGTGGASVIAAKVTFTILGCWVLGAMIYTIIAELSPSYTNDFASCIITNVVDLYVHIGIFAVWIAYKESSWTSAFFWIVLLVCFRGVTLCVYLLRELFYLSPQQPASLILFNNANRDLHSSDPLLMTHPNEV